MKTWGLRLAGVLAITFLIGCSGGKSPEAPVAEILDLHRPGLWTPVVTEHWPYLDYKASDGVQRKLDRYVASRLSLNEETKFDHALFVEDLALDPVLKYEILSSTDLGNGKIEVLALVTRPKARTLERLWQVSEVFQAKWNAQWESEKTDGDQAKIRAAKEELRRFVERFKRTREAVQAIDELETTETHFVVKAATKEGGPKLLLAETWTPEGRKKQEEAARVLKHSLTVLQILKPELNSYRRPLERTHVRFIAFNPSEEKTGSLTAEVELLDAQDRPIARENTWVSEIKPGQSEQVFALFDGAVTQRWRVRFGEREQYSEWYRFEGTHAVESD